MHLSNDIQTDYYTSQEPFDLHSTFVCARGKLASSYAIDAEKPHGTKTAKSSSYQRPLNGSMASRHTVPGNREMFFSIVWTHLEFPSFQTHRVSRLPIFAQCPVQ